jgi:hypothetical protein
MLSLSRSSVLHFISSFPYIHISRRTLINWLAQFHNTFSLHHTRSPPPPRERKFLCHLIFRLFSVQLDKLSYTSLPYTSSLKSCLQPHLRRRCLHYAPWASASSSSSRSSLRNPSLMHEQCQLQIASNQQHLQLLSLSPEVCFPQSSPRYEINLTC